MSHIPPVSFGVRTTLPAYRIVMADTAGSNFAILPSSAAVGPMLGITVDSVRDTTGAIPVAIGGIAKLQMNETMGTGGLVAPDGGGLGLGVPHVAVSAGSFVIGTLVGPAVTLTGTISEILINPLKIELP
jgi:hypothetical protein